MAESEQLDAEAPPPLAPEEWVVSVALLVMVAINFAGIVFRYWIHVSLPWTEEVEVALFIWVVFLGAGLTVVRRLHIGFPPIVERLPRAASRVITEFGVVAFAAFFAVLAWFGASMVRSEIAFGQVTPTLGWPEALIGIAIPVGAVLALLRIGVHLLQRRRG